MSLSREGQDGEWYDITPGYVYISKDRHGRKSFNHPIGTPVHFAELAMRALDQSGELDSETLADCRDAFATRFDLEDEP